MDEPPALQPEQTRTDPDHASAGRVRTYDAPPGQTSARRPWVLGICVSLPVALFAVLQPERYSLTPNSLDPVFYTGYSVNLDDVLSAVGDRHYFVSRWTAYYPVHLLDLLVSPMAARLTWRWFLAALMVWSVVTLGERLRWGRATSVVVSIVVLSMPAFLRAFFSDYVEYLVVSLGTALVVACLREEQSMLSASGIGLLGSALVIANPVAGFLAVPAVGLAFVLFRRGRHPGAVLVTIGVVTGSAVSGLGFVLFRWRYGIENVYAPSLRFVRTHSGDLGEWKSPRSAWIGTFSWIYIPALVLATAVVLSAVRRVRWTRVEVGALGLCAIVLALQTTDQLVRDGISLEASFYWSFGLPAYLVALAVVLARMCDGASHRALVAVPAIWLLVLLVGVPDGLRLPASWPAAVIALAVLGLMAHVVRYRPTVGAGLAAIGTLWMQIGAPPYRCGAPSRSNCPPAIAWLDNGAAAFDPGSQHHLNMSPRYDSVIGRSATPSDAVFGEAMWFADQMDHVPSDARTSFIAAGGWSSSIAALYAPHVVGRLILPEEGAVLPDQTVREIRSGLRPVVAIFGDQREVAEIYADLGGRVELSTPILDVTRDRGLRSRLVVLSMPDATRLPFTWTADVLPRVGGETTGHEVMAAPPGIAGVLTYGPYLQVEPGPYEVTFRYRADAASDVLVGSADVAASGARVVAVDLHGTDGTPAEASVRFESAEVFVAEFRTFWSGSAPMWIDSITLERASR